LKLQLIIKQVKNSVNRNERPKCSAIDLLATLKISRILSSMSEIFYDNQQFQFAKLAAFWGLLKALKFDRKLTETLRCFSRLLKIIFATGEVDKFFWIQKLALEETAKNFFYDELNKDGLIKVMRVYREILNCK
jgi:hypothetical protein